MIRFYFHLTPNPAKVALFHEEATRVLKAKAIRSLHIPTSRGGSPRLTPVQPSRARAVGAGHAFRQERDEAALRAQFPSNYPAAA